MYAQPIGTSCSKCAEGTSKVPPSEEENWTLVGQEEIQNIFDERASNLTTKYRENEDKKIFACSRSMIPVR